MPPKVKTESTELQVFNLEKFSIAQLPEFQAKKDEIGAVIALNPIVEIIDNSTYELAKKSRTAVKTLRTGLEKEQADVKRKIKTNILDVVDKEYDQLVLDVKKQESDRQTPITTYEAEAELKRQEKARIEQERIDGIKKEIEDYTSQWKTAINLMTFDSITKVSAEFLESYTSFDTTILQEFEALFPVKVEELSQLLSYKTVSLTNAENARLENIRLEEEAESLRFEKARLEALARIAEAAEVKAKKEREDFEKEKAEFEAKKKASEAIENAVYDLPKTPPTEKVEIPEILVPEIPTVNVCTSKENKYAFLFSDVPPNSTGINHPGALSEESINHILKTVGIVDEGTTTTIIFSELPTWDDIANDFKTSGEKSYSKWLKSNYNVPTKL